MRLLFAAGLAAISACAADANPPPLLGAAEHTAPMSEPVSASAADLGCEVRAIRTENGFRFEATAFSDAEAAGEYELVINKRDRDGEGEIVQGGEFALGGGDRQSLGSAEISVARGGSYNASLVLHDADGVACTAERSR